MDLHLLTTRMDASAGPGSDADAASVPWWSFTKTALATAALQLVARSRLRLDAPLDGRPYTLRQLLQHRAGVPNYGGLAACHAAVARGDAPWTVAELLQRVDAGRLDFAPGTGWCYSNVGYLFVRQLIEQATGEDIGAALRHLVFDALGLRSVRLATSVAELDETAWGSGGYDPNWVYHGLLIGTPGDAARFLHALMSGQMLPADVLADMTAPHPVGERWPGRPWETAGYGLGLMIGEMTGAGLAVGHTGGGPGSVSAVYHFANRARPCTAAAFISGDDQGVVEHAVARLAGPH
jgi:D-alanyl-D-alanine carboxypeptidase